jgi:hypothetical protein
MNEQPDTTSHRPDDADAVARGDDGLPPDLLADLRSLHARPPVPAGMDFAIRSQARAYLAQQRRVRWGVRIAGAAAAAAVLGIGVWRAMLPTTVPTNVALSPPSAATVAAASLADDVNGDGVVDVLDAFAIARGVRDRQTRPEWDINRDGRVDAQDADALARLAVSVRNDGGVP